MDSHELGNIVFLAKDVTVTGSQGVVEKCYILLVQCTPQTHAVAIVESPQATVVPLLTVILKDYNELVEDPENHAVVLRDVAFVQSVRFEATLKFAGSSDYSGFVGAYSRAMKSLFDYNMAVVRQVARTFMVADNAGQL